mmetsp:Transcript_91425/g.229790  ORF Transcript_91425/g.229790 Transcript_91425/m.229790 type:complete len:355 (+) Transcript_91425:208-1272(+)
MQSEVPCCTRPLHDWEKEFLGKSCIVPVQHMLEVTVRQHLQALGSCGAVLQADRLEQLNRLLPHFLGGEGVRQSENWFRHPELHQERVHSDGIWLGEEPLVERLELRVELVVPAAMHQLVHQAGDDVRCDGDHTHGAMNMSREVALFVVAGPTSNALVAEQLDPLVAHALLHAHKVRVILDTHDDLRLDVLACPSGHIVDDAGAVLETVLQMHDDALGRRLAVVWVDEQRAIHTSRKSLPRCDGSLTGAHAACVANNRDLAPEHGLCVRNEKQVLLPRQEMALACRTADNQCLHTVSDLVLDDPVESGQVHIAVCCVRSLDRRHEAQFPQLQGLLRRHLRLLARRANGHDTGKL